MWCTRGVSFGPFCNLVFVSDEFWSFKILLRWLKIPEATFDGSPSAPRFIDHRSVFVYTCLQLLSQTSARGSFGGGGGGHGSVSWGLAVDDFDDTWPYLT